MKNLTNLFNLMELTRAQVQQGYLLSGIHKNDLSGLADHQYLVTFIGWRLAKYLKDGGADIDVQKILEFCLIHDLGELMGGDISTFYGKMNKRARKYAKLFEEENQKYLSKFFGDDAKYIRKISKEILDAKSNEALVAKVADYMECAHFKVYLGRLTKSDKEYNKLKLNGFIRKIKDKTAKKLLQDFMIDWSKNVDQADYLKILGTR